MLNPWKRKVKRENKVAQILASVESNPNGENVLKDIIKERLPNRSFSDDSLSPNPVGLERIQDVKTEKTLFDDSDEKENNIFDKNDSIDTNSLENYVNGEKKKNGKPSIVKRRKLEKEGIKKLNSRKSVESNSDNNSDQDSNRSSCIRISKKATSKPVTREMPTLIQKWTRSSEDSYEQQLALAIQQSLNEANKNGQVDILEESTKSSLSTTSLEQIGEYSDVIKLSYRAKCIDDYCNLCEEMYLGHSLLDLPQIVFKKMQNFEFAPKNQPEICWNRAWNSYKLLCSNYRKKHPIDLWGPKEVILFELAMFRIGKEFYKMHKLIQTKTVKEIVDFYYIWKKTQRYYLWKLVRYLTFEELQTKEISDNLFTIISSISNMESDESSAKIASPNTNKGSASTTCTKKTKADSKSKHKK